MYTGQQGRGPSCWRTLENPFFIQLKLLIYCSIMYHAKHFWLCPPLCKEKCGAQELSLSMASFLSPAGMWARLSPLVYWLQSVIAQVYDFLGCWSRRCNQFMKHTGLFFFCKNVFISASIFRDQDLKELLKRIYLWMPCFITLSKANTELSRGELCFNSSELTKGKMTSQNSAFATFSP